MMKGEIMPSILSKDELKNRLEIVYDKKVTNREARKIRQHNINSFSTIIRENLMYNKLERRMLLYTTLNGEKVYIQYPGKESIESVSKPLDFRPKLIMENGMMLRDMDFGIIWDVLDQIRENHKESLYFVANLFYRMSYMTDYRHYDGKYLVEECDIDNEVTRFINEENLDWYGIEFEEDIWHTLNEYIGMISLDETSHISFEGFVKYIDLLFQNEDCKYYYKNVVIDGKQDYNLSSGRNASGGANLLVLNYLEGNIRLSGLLNQFQKTRGVPQIAKKDYSLVTKDSVLTVEEYKTKQGNNIK